MGAIYTFASGNGGQTGDSCAYNGYVNSIYTIAINGLNMDGSLPSYSEECPGIMATAYSRDSQRRLGKVVSRGVDLFAGEPKARQHVIPYNSGKKPKFVQRQEPKHAQSIVFFLSGVFVFV